MNDTPTICLLSTNDQGYFSGDMIIMHKSLDVKIKIKL